LLFQSYRHEPDLFSFYNRVQARGIYTASRAMGKTLGPRALASPAVSCKSLFILVVRFVALLKCTGISYLIPKLESVSSPPPAAGEA